MKIVPRKVPVAFESSIPEPDTDEGTAWDKSKTYAEKERTHYSHVVYQSLAGGNIGNQPDTTMDGTDAKWRKIGSTNKWACFDLQYSTQSTRSSGDIVITLDAEFVDTVALLNVNGEWCRVDVHDEGEAAPYWTSGNFVLTQDVQNEWDYEFLPIVRKGDAFFTGFPPCILGKITITIHAAGDQKAAVGHVIPGFSQDVGATLYGVAAGSRSFSRVTEDAFGEVSIVKRRNAKRFNGEVFCREEEIDGVMDLLASIDATPVLFIGDNRSGEKGGLRMLTVFGILKTYESTVPGPGISPITVSIEGIA